MKRIAFVSLVALAVAGSGAAYAQAPGSADLANQAAGRAGNILGGGSASILGGGEDLMVVYGVGGAGGGAGLPAQPGRFARLRGSDGDGQQVEYLEPAQRGLGRVARVIGGGDDAEVVYAPAEGRR